MQRPSRSRHSALIWQRTRARQNTRLSTSSKAGVSKAAKTGRVGIIGPSGITDLRGTTGVGGTIITTVSFSYMVGGMLGTRAIGTRLGATLPMRIMLTMARSMPITACRPIRWSPTFRPRCNSKAIIKAKWTACSGHLRARRLQLTRPNRAYKRPQPMISRHWNR